MRAVRVEQPDELARDLPVSTIRTTSMASGVVTRRPPRNSDSMPSRSSIALICGPPPCTTTGRRPTWRRNTMSCANARLRSSSIMALPPYFTTTSAPRELLQPRQRLDQHLGLLLGAQVGAGVEDELSLMWSTRCSRGRSRA